MSEAPSGVVGESTGSPRSDPARTYRTAIAFTPTIKLGGLEVDILHRRVRAGPSELHLTSIDQSLLYLLAANAGRLVTREQILDSLWGVDFAAGSNLVDRHVRNLRTKLHDNWRRPRFIATRPGPGIPLPSRARGGARDRWLRINKGAIRTAHRDAVALF